jgi:hypothetical protein
VGSTLIGVLVAGTLAPGPRVDAFFAANQIFALSLFLGQAVRITAPALLVRSGVSVASLSRATAALAGGVVGFLVLVALIGDALVADAARSAFRSDLLVLAPAAGVQVVAGALAARMAILGSFGSSAGAWAAGSVISGLLLLVFIDGRGASALAPCTAAGSASVGLIMTLAFRAVEHRRAALSDVDGVGPAPERGSLVGVPGTKFALQRIGLGAIPALSVQLLTTVVTLAAGHVVPGGTALLSYAFLALFAFTMIAITPMSIVLGPEVAERWEGDADGLIGIIRQATRLSMVVAVPLVALGFLIGRPLAAMLLGILTGHELSEIFAMLAILTPSLLLLAASTAATVGITAADRLGALAARLLLAGAATVIAGVVLAATGPSLLVVAAVACVFSLAYSAITVAVALPGRAVETLKAIVVDNAAVVAPALVATLALSPLATTSLLIGSLLSSAVLVLHACVVLVLRRDTVQLLVGAARRQAA